MKRLMRLSIIVCFLVLSLSVKSFALDTAVGNFGLGAGSKATPNTWILIYAAQWYEGNIQNEFGEPRRDARGDKITSRVISNNFRTIIWTDYKILGAYFGFDLSVPLVSVSNSNGVSLSGVGDVFFAPINLSWTTKQFDAHFAFTLGIPVGDDDIGSKHFSYSLAPSFSYYIDKERRFELNLAPVVEFHDQNRYSNTFTDGTDLLIRYGVGYRYETFKIGVVGYSAIQIGKDSKVNPNWKVNDQEQVHALGGEASYFFPSSGLALRLLVTREIYAESRALGTRVHLAFSKVFN